MTTKQLATSSNADARSLIESHGLSSALSGEHDGVVLSGWLNAAKGSDAHRRIVEIVRLIEATTKSNNEARAIGAYRPRPYPAKFPEEQKAKLREVDALYSQLQSVLARYVYRTNLALGSLDSSWLLNFNGPQQDGDFVWENELKSSSSKAAQVIPPFATYRVLESDAALAALRLAERGLIDRIRLCATCAEKWIFANHKNYTFCSKPCREKSFRDNPEYLKRKKDQMRKYRELARKRDTAAVESIRKHRR
jgi:hypothetical protein